MLRECRFDAAASKAMNVLPLLLTALQAATPPSQIVLAFDEPKPDLTARVFACQTVAAVEDLARRENLVVHVDKGVVLVYPRDILFIDRTLGRARLLEFLTSAKHPHEARNLHDLPREHQEQLRREIARQAGTQTSLVLRSKSAPFTFEPQLLVHLEQGAKRITVDLGAKKKRSFDDTLDLLVDPTPVPGDKYPLGVEPEKPVPNRPASLTFHFADSSRSAEERLEQTKAFLQLLESRVADARTEYEKAASLALDLLLDEYSDIHLQDRPNSLKDLPERLRSLAQSHIVNGMRSAFSSREDASAFASSAQITDLTYVPTIMFRIKDFYHESSQSRGMGLTVPTIRLDNPLGKR